MELMLLSRGKDFLRLHAQIRASMWCERLGPMSTLVSSSPAGGSALPCSNAPLGSSAQLGALADRCGTSCSLQRQGNSMLAIGALAPDL